jgi:hypothetical protein
LTDTIFLTCFFIFFCMKHVMSNFNVFWFYINIVLCNCLFFFIAIWICEWFISNYQSSCFWFV